jgi:hypothetical protein
MIVRCKAFVTNVSTNEYGQSTVSLQLAYSQTPGTENYQFHASSPSGNLKLLYSGVVGEANLPTEMFKPGSWWYIDTERVAEMTDVDHNSFCWMSGVEHMAGYFYNSVEQAMVKQPMGAIRCKCKGFYNGMQFDSDIYIANRGVFDEFAEIGTLYKLSFTETVKA